MAEVITIYKEKMKGKIDKVLLLEKIKASWQWNMPIKQYGRS